jgi:hypothetical protein
MLLILIIPWNFKKIMRFQGSYLDLRQVDNDFHYCFFDSTYFV